jgi:hypothetical protein
VCSSDLLIFNGTLVNSDLGGLEYKFFIKNV